MHLKKIKILSVLLILLNLFAADPGDARQLLSYKVTDLTRPDVADGLIAPSTDPTDWSAAYVRNIVLDVDGITPNAPAPGSILISNDQDTLYIAVVIELTNAADGNRVMITFDQGISGILEGAPGAPGEYYVTMLANGDPAEDGYWNGSAWTLNSVPAAVGCGERRGSGGTQTYNYEFKIPLSRTNDASNGYLNIQAGDEIRALFKVTMATGGNDDYYWVQTNADDSDPAGTGANGSTGWAEIQTIGDGIADRNLVCLNAKGIIPTIDGNVSGDANWKYAFHKDIILTDFNGNIISGSIKLKEDSDTSYLYFGVIVNDYTPLNGDIMTFFFDQGSSGGNQNFVLNQAGDPYHDNAFKMTKSGTGFVFEDMNFNSTTWTQDGSSTFGASWRMSGSNWESEYRIPYYAGDTDDLNLISDDIIGALFKLHDSTNNRDYWLSSTINSEIVEIDPVDPVYNALGWAILQTGGPFVQSIYPEDGDTISGEYPLAVYAVDPTDAVPELGIAGVTYEIRLEDTIAGTYIVLQNGTMNKVEDDNIPIWTATFDTKTINQPLNTLLKLVYVIEDGEIDPVSVPLSIYINNEGGYTLSDPNCSISTPLPHAELSGSGNSVGFTVETDSLLTINEIKLYIDGEQVSSYAPEGVYQYSDSYSWDTSSLQDGEHIIQVWAENSLNISTYSPTTLVYTKNSPTVNITSPAGSSVQSGIVNIQFTATPVAPALLASTVISIDGGAWTAVTAAPVNTGGTGSHDWDTTNIPDGTHGITIRTTDNSGRTAYSEDIFVITDNMPNVSITSPEGSELLNGTVTIQFTASPVAPALLASTVISIDGGAWTAVTTAPVNTGGTGSHNWDTIGLTDGSHEIILRTTDYLNRTGYSEDIVVITDNSAPMGVVKADPVNIKNGDTVIFEYTGHEPDLSVTLPLVQLQLLDNGTNAAASLNLTDADMDGVYAVSYVISADNSVVDGVKTPMLSVTDPAGNIFTPAVTLRLDNTQPVIVAVILPEPVIGEVFESSIILDCTYHDEPDSNFVSSVVLTHTNAYGDNIGDTPLSIPLTGGYSFTRTIELIEGYNIITVAVVDMSGNVRIYQTELIYTDPRVTNVIGDDGGTVTSPDGTSVIIPADALLSDSEITIRTVSADSYPAPYGGIVLLPNSHLFGPDNLIFHEPVKISLAYNDMDLDTDLDGTPDIDESGLEVFTLENSSWIKIVSDGTDTVNNLVTFTTNHFSVYAIGTQSDTAEFSFYWTKNPFNAEQTTTAVIDLTEGGKVNLKIYDLSGDLVRILANEMSVSGTTNIKWDGKNDYDRYVGSGIYVYVFEYEDMSGKKKTVKKPVGVIK